MKKYYSGKLIVFLLLFCHPNVKSETPVDSALAAALQNKIENYLTQYSIPGISVTVFLPGERVWSGAAGLSHIYNLTPMDTSHTFEMASVTKTYTAAIIFQLMEEGLLTLDDTVGQYLPPMNYVPSGTTIRNMIKHRSGLYNYTNNSLIANEWFNDPDSIWPHLQMINTYVDSPPSFAQGAAYEYSNTNFFLLGMIIEAITGNTFADELKNRILIPHGLSHIYFPPEDSIPAAANTPGWTSFTTAGVYDTDASPILNDCSRSMAYTAGGIVAKPSDACKFTKLLWTGNIISDSSLNIMKQCTNLNSGYLNGYGYGTMRYTFNGKTYYGHGGDISGFTELVFYGTTDSVGAIISINRNSAPRGSIAINLMSYINAYLLTSVENFEQYGFDLSVYPNPASEKINLQFSSSEKRNLEISIYNQFGKAVRQNINYTSTGNNTYSIDVSDLASGIYYVRLTIDDKIISRKIVLMNEN